MKKYVLLTASLALASPLLMAQNTNDSTNTDSSKQKATSTLPVPTSTSDSPVGVEGPTTNDEGQTSGSAKAGQNSVGATGNKDNKSAKTRTRTGGVSTDFASIDANTDGKISQDELKANPTLSAKFKQSDANSDGTLSRAEFAKLQGPLSKSDTGRNEDGTDSQKQNVTEGSDRTDKDDQLNRNLPGQ